MHQSRRSFVFVFFLCLTTTLLFAQDTHYIKVHFLYGSTPKKQFADEPKWFGGILGGHVGIEVASNQVLNFIPQGSFHLVAKKENLHSAYAIHINEGFYGILGGNANEVKKMIITIPVTTEQKKKLDSIADAYMAQTPYDYALAGMRCGAAAYEILAQLNSLPRYDHHTTSKLIMYPAILRNKLLVIANGKSWLVDREAGSERRHWEKG